VQALLEAHLEIGLCRRQAQGLRLASSCRGLQSLAEGVDDLRMGSRLSLSAAWFTTRRDEMSMMRSTSTSWLALSVLPVDTRSTMASARPVSGASSMLP
jgi:hypothetical protein